MASCEDRVDKVMKETDHLSEALETEGKVPLGRKALAQKIGTLFREQSSINVQLAFLETPAYFWDHPAQEAPYMMVVAERVIKERTHILNSKLSMLHDLYQILRDELNARHSEILELTIVALILIEVVLAIVSFVTHGFVHGVDFAP